MALTPPIRVSPESQQPFDQDLRPYGGRCRSARLHGVTDTSGEIRGHVAIYVPAPEKPLFEGAIGLLSLRRLPRPDDPNNRMRV